MQEGKNLSTRRQFLKESLLISLATSLEPAERLLAQLSIRASDWVMTREQTADYMMHEVAPALDRVLRDPKELPKLRQRVANLFYNRIKNKRIEYLAMPAYFPKAKDKVAHIDFNAQTDKLILMIFVPAMRDFINQLKKDGYKQKDIDFLIANVFSHEEIHLELAKKYPFSKQMGPNADRALSARDEAEAWGEMLLETIEPGLQAGRRIPKNLVESLQTLKSLKSDYANPAWVKFFENQEESGAPQVK